MANDFEIPSGKKGLRRALLTMLGGLAAAPAVPAADAPQSDAAQVAPRKAANNAGNKANKAGKGAPQEAVVYKKVGGETLSLFVTRPASVAAGSKPPCVVFFHGGGYRTGTPDKFRVMGQALADRGILVMTVQYRLLTEGELVPKEAIEDGRSAMRYIHSHAEALGCDTNRIAAAGGSAGGHLAFMTALKSPYEDPADDLRISPKPGALILLNSPFNLARYKSDLATAISPYHLMDRDLPPTLVLHGTADKVVPFSQATQFKERAALLGAKEVTIVPFEGRGHGFFHAQKGDGSDFKTVIDQITGFLRRLGW